MGILLKIGWRSQTPGIMTSPLDRAQALRLQQLRCVGEIDDLVQTRESRELRSYEIRLLGKLVAFLQALDDEIRTPPALTDSRPAGPPCVSERI